MKLGLSAVALTAAALMLSACDSEQKPVRVYENAAARVDCGTPGPGGVDCAVQRTAGEGAFEACWQLVITCENDGEMRADACHQVAAGESEASANMPVASFSNQAGCDAPAAGRVENLKVMNR